MVRQHLPSVLKPDFSKPDATATHESLLNLARGRNGRLRLITTNFDRVFEEAIRTEKLEIPKFEAPLLPVPKNRWNGLVYLHGLLPNNPTQDDLDQLVLSSGDFGLAYLTEAWAARFVAEVFRNFTVCFVGYSINDPVLRYMTDAIAADRLLGESPLEAFVFASFSKGKEVEQAIEWEAKNVTPILYRMYRSHLYLHKTLRIWGDTYRDGLYGKEHVVVSLAGANPRTSTEDDDFVGRMLWALSDPSGLPARRFAILDPVPGIEWLEPLTKNRYGHSDLYRFGAPPKAIEDGKLSFSQLKRPTPYDLAPEMALVNSVTSGRLDKIMSHLASWLTRHLNDPQLVLWVANQGGQLHHEFRELIESSIRDPDRWEEEGHQANIRNDAPNAVPNPLMRILWQLVLSGRLKPTIHTDSDLWNWSDRLKQDGLTYSLRMELREILAPRVVIKKPFSYLVQQNEPSGPQSMEDLVDWDIVLSADDVHSALRELRGRPYWESILPDLLPDFSLLLRDALGLMSELSGTEDGSALFSWLHQPSISDHSQNRDSHDWTALIILVRDAWIETAKRDSSQARLAAESWRKTPYSLFRRLAFFAAVKDDVIPTDQALTWLLEDDNRWLWSVETRREAIRLLVALAPRLDVTAMTRLNSAILHGPPREMYNDDMEDDQWGRTVDREIWLRLAKLEDARC